MKNLVLIFAIVFGAFQLSGCNKKKDQEESHVSYYQNNGVCYSRQNHRQVDGRHCGLQQEEYFWVGEQCQSRRTGQLVSPELCRNTHSSGQNYFLVNGICYDRRTGATVPTNLCHSQNQPVTPGGPVFGQSCYGTYYYIVNGQSTPISCEGQNCSGLTLFDASGREVYCQ